MANNIDREALEVLRLLLWQTERGRNLDASLVERAKALFENYDRVMQEARALGVPGLHNRLLAQRRGRGEY